MPAFDELIAMLLDEPEEALGVLNDIVSRGRLQADDLDEEAVAILARYDLIAFLVQRANKGPVRTWVYPSPLGLKTFGFLERAAEHMPEETPVVKVKRRRQSSDSGVSR